MYPKQKLFRRFISSHTDRGELFIPPREHFFKNNFPSQQKGGKLCPPETSQKLWFSDVFMEYRNEFLAWNESMSTLKLFGTINNFSRISSVQCSILYRNQLLHFRAVFRDCFGDTVFWNGNFSSPTPWLPAGKKITSF